MRRASTCSRLSFRAVAIAIVCGGIVNLPAIAIAFSGSDGAAVSGPPVISSRLGVLLADATGTSGAEREGAVVRVVIPGGGAEKAGLLAGDLLVECDDEPVQNARGVIRLLQGTPHSGAVRLSLERNTRRLSITVGLDSGDVFDFLAPFMEGLVREGPYLRTLPRGGTDRLGVTVLDLTPQLGAYFGARLGVLISSVRPWSPADRAGLRAGDVVTVIDGHTVMTATEFARALHRDLSTARLLIGVTRDRRDQVVEVKIQQ